MTSTCGKFMLHSVVVVVILEGYAVPTFSFPIFAPYPIRVATTLSFLLANIYTFSLTVNRTLWKPYDGIYNS